MGEAIMAFRSRFTGIPVSHSGPSVLPQLLRLEIEAAVLARVGIWNLSRASSGLSFGMYDKRKSV